MLSASKSSERPTLDAWKLLVPAGLAQLALLALMGWWAGPTRPIWMLGLFFAAFGIYLWVASRVLDSFGGHVLVWVFAVAMRLVLLPLTPELSDEVYRYLWDGEVQLHGFNPYRYAPADPALAEVSSEWLAPLRDASARSAHPPLSQMVFVLLAMAGGAVLQAKLLWIGLDLTIGWLLGRVARLTGRSRRLTQILYLWSPLLLVEVAWNANAVPLALFGIVLVVLLARVPTGAGAAAAVASLAAPPVIIAAPPLARRLGWGFLGGFAAALVVFTLPYLSGVGAMVSAAFAAVTETRFMEGPFLLLESAGPWTAIWVAFAICLGVSVWTTAQRFRPERALFWVLGAWLLLTPAAHPWTALLVLPLAALRVSRPWILFTGLAALGYYGAGTFIGTGEWPQPGWLRILMWVPVLLLLVMDAARLWRERVPLPREPLPGES